MLSNQQYRYFTTSFKRSGNRWIQSCEHHINRQRRSLAEPTVAGGAYTWVVGSDYELDYVALRKDNILERVSFDGNSTELLTSAVPLFVAQGSPLISIVTPNGTSPSTLAVPTPDGGRLFVNERQQLTQLSRLYEDATSSMLRSLIDPLIDAHITFSTTNQLWAVHTRATKDRYVHGILGDRFEGYELEVLQWNSTTNLVAPLSTISLADEDDSIVFEQLAPMWADVDGDGVEDLVTTVARARPKRRKKATSLTLSGMV